MTIVDSVADEHYGADRKTLAMRFARALNAEARELAAAGADVIQFDEPCFNIYVDEVEAWGIEALEQCMDGVSARKAVHICYGYGTPAVLAWKTKNTDWGHYGVTLPLLAEEQRGSGLGRVRGIRRGRVGAAGAGRQGRPARGDRRRHRGGRDARGRGRPHSARAGTRAGLAAASVYRLRTGAAQPGGLSG